MLRKIIIGGYIVLLFPIFMVVISFYRVQLCSFVTGGRILAVLPGEAGMFLRRFWYQHTLESCGKDLYVDWMAIIKSSQSSIGDNVYIGTFCWIGRVTLGNDVMLGGHITILSGAHTHSFDDLDIPMTQQKVTLQRITIGHDVWVGNRAIIMANVEWGCVIGAGAVVNKTYAPFDILVGLPAKPIGNRKTPKSAN